MKPIAPRTVTLLLCLSLGLPAPVFGLRPELDRDALEQALHPAAGLEEAGADRLRAAYPYLGAEKAA